MDGHVERGVWLPHPGTVLRMLIVARLISAFFMHISDCDETFNYWEPVSCTKLVPRPPSLFPSPLGSLPSVWVRLPDVGVLPGICYPFLWLPLASRLPAPGDQQQEQGVVGRPASMPSSAPSHCSYCPSLQIVTFYLLRIILAVACALCESYLYRYARSSWECFP